MWVGVEGRSTGAVCLQHGLLVFGVNLLKFECDSCEQSSGLESTEPSYMPEELPIKGRADTDVRFAVL